MDMWTGDWIQGCSKLVDMDSNMEEDRALSEQPDSSFSLNFFIIRNKILGGF